MPTNPPTTSTLSRPDPNGEIAGEGLCRVGLARAIKDFPELQIGGHRLTPPLLNRWCTRGVRGVVLDSELIGGRRFIHRAGVRIFLATLNNRSVAEPDSAAGGDRRDWVRQRLAEAGI